MQAADNVLFKVGGASFVPPSGHKLLIVDTDGVLKTIDSSGNLVPVVGAATRQSPGAVQDVTFSGLNGDLDGDYELTGRIIMPNAGTITYSIQPNALSTNQAGLTTVCASGGGTAANSPTVAWLITGIGSGGAGSLVKFRARITSKTGFVRNCQIFGQDYQLTVRRNFLLDADWTDTATNITSLVVHADTAGGIAAGSSFVLRSLGAHTAC